MGKQEKLNELIKYLAEKLNNQIKWAFFGGLAIAIHKNDFYRQFEDIDIIIEDKEHIIKTIFPNFKLKPRHNRKRGSLKINGISVDFLFMTKEKEIDLADGIFNFHGIEELKFINLKLPVIDLQSLYSAKLRHKISLKKDKNQNKLKTTISDIEIITELLGIKVGDRE